MVFKLPSGAKSLEGIDERFHDLYEEDDDAGFLLTGIEVTDEGSTYVQTLGEFRRHNGQLTTEVETLKSELGKFTDVDLDAYRKGQEALQTLDGIEDRRILEDQGVEKLKEEAERKAIARVTDAHEEAMRKQLTHSKTLEEQLQKTKVELGGMRMRTMTDSILGKEDAPRVRKGMDPYLHNDVSSHWYINDDNIPTPRNPDQAYDIKGRPFEKSEAGVEAWLREHAMGKGVGLFESSAGGGSGDDAGGESIHNGVRIIKNPTAAQKGELHEEIIKGTVQVVYE